MALEQVSVGLKHRFSSISAVLVDTVYLLLLRHNFLKREMGKINIYVKSCGKFKAVNK